MNSTASDADPDDHATIAPDAPEMNRYASFDPGGGIVVYDRENENGWLQSDERVELSEWR